MMIEQLPGLSFWLQVLAGTLAIVFAAVLALVWRSASKGTPKAIGNAAAGLKRVWKWLDDKWPDRWRVGWRRKREDDWEKRLKGLEAEVSGLHEQVYAAAFLLAVAFQELGEVSPGLREKLTEWLTGMSLNARLSEGERSRRGVKPNELARAQAYKWVHDNVFPGRPLVVEWPAQSQTALQRLTELEAVFQLCVDEITKSGDWAVREPLAEKLRSSSEFNKSPEGSIGRDVAKALSQGTFMENLLTQSSEP